MQKRSLEARDDILQYRVGGAFTQMVLFKMIGLNRLKRKKF